MKRNIPLVSAAIALLTGCDDSAAQREPAGPGSVSSATTAKLPELVKVPSGAADGPALLRAELERAERDGYKLVVYVGATWCEPCQYFHRALERGDLNRELAGVRFLDFDFDAHGSLLEEAGCQSQLIPLFARPTAEGRCGERRAEGGIKGDGAVGYLMPRLQQLL